MDELEIEGLRDQNLREEVFSVLASACLSHRPSSLALLGSKVVSNLAVAFAKTLCDETLTGGVGVLGTSRRSLGEHLAEAACLVEGDAFSPTDAAPLVLSLASLLGMLKAKSKTSYLTSGSASSPLTGWAPPRSSRPWSLSAGGRGGNNRANLFAAAEHVVSLSASSPGLTTRQFADLVFALIDSSVSPGDAMMACLLKGAPGSVSRGSQPVSPAAPGPSGEDFAYAMSAVSVIRASSHSGEAESAYLSYCDGFASFYRKGRPKLKHVARAIRAGADLGVCPYQIIRVAERLTEVELRAPGGLKHLVDLGWGCKTLRLGEVVKARAAAAVMDAPFESFSPRLIADAAVAFGGKGGMVLHLATASLAIRDWTLAGATAVLVALGRVSRDGGSEAEQAINKAHTHIARSVLESPPELITSEWAAVLGSAFANRQSAHLAEDVLQFLAGAYPGGGRAVDDGRMASALARGGISQGRAWHVIEVSCGERDAADVTDSEVAILVEAFAKSGRLAASPNLIKLASSALIARRENGRSWDEVGATLGTLSSVGMVDEAVLKRVASEFSSELKRVASEFSSELKRVASEFSSELAALPKPLPSGDAGYGDPRTGYGDLSSPRRRSAFTAEQRMPPETLVSVFQGLSKAKLLDLNLFLEIGLRAVDYADRGLLSGPQIATVVNLLATSKVMWGAPSETESIFRALSVALRRLPRSALKPQVAAVVAGAYAKVRIFDEALFVRISECVRWRNHKASDYSVQAVGILLYAFSRVEVDDPQLLEFLSTVIRDLPPQQFTPQAISVVVSVYAGAHRRKTGAMTASTEPVKVADLPAATGILDYIARVAQIMGPSRFDTRHVRAIVEAYHRAGVRPEGLYEVMHLAWRSRWGSGFKSDQEMVDFLTSLQLKAPGPRKAGGVGQDGGEEAVQGGEDDIGSIFKRWLSIGNSEDQR